MIQSWWRWWWYKLQLINVVVEVVEFASDHWSVSLKANKWYISHVSGFLKQCTFIGEFNEEKKQFG